MPRDQQPPSKGAILRFSILLALVFLTQGIAQNSGILSQTMTYFFKSLGWQPDQVTRFFALLIIPWIIKPVYGFLSDRLPIAGWRRKPYLMLFNALATLSALWLARIMDPGLIFAALMINCTGMAASSTIYEAVLVENGNAWQMSGKFLNQQWFWYNTASIAAALGGGWLADTLTPAAAFHTAAYICAAVPLSVVVGAWFLLDEKSGERLPLLDTQGIFGDKKVWMAALFLFVWNIVPGFGTPMYYHMVDSLHFDQTFIGILSAVASGGSVLGAFLYAFVARRLTLQQILYGAAALGALSTAAYIWLLNPASALAINFVGGVVGTVSLVASLAVAAHVTPAKSAGFIYALLMSVSNLAGQLASNIGSWLYVHMFHHHLLPVIIIAAVGTLLAAAVIPLLKLGDASGNHLRRPTAPRIHPAAIIERKRFS